MHTAGASAGRRRPAITSDRPEERNNRCSRRSELRARPTDAGAPCRLQRARNGSRRAVIGIRVVSVLRCVLPNLTPCAASRLLEDWKEGQDEKYMHTYETERRPESDDPDGKTSADCAARRRPPRGVFRRFQVFRAAPPGCPTRVSDNDSGTATCGCARLRRRQDTDLALPALRIELPNLPQGAHTRTLALASLGRRHERRAERLRSASLGPGCSGCSGCSLLGLGLGHAIDGDPGSAQLPSAACPAAVATVG